MGDTPCILCGRLNEFGVCDLCRLDIGRTLDHYQYDNATSDRVYLFCSGAFVLGIAILVLAALKEYLS